LQGIVERFLDFTLFFIVRIFFPWYLHAHKSSKCFNCWYELHMLILHDEFQCVAGRLAAKAIIKLLVLADTEGAGFLLVERAESGVILAGFLERKT
jgi:hypothetical protein